ncbi:hypothetical protein MKW94_000176 [Papaver nudicaule]|uniref:DNA (cytosine-5-)-methyltransferase n=1 Tax=Papaver nudicaule TaxID=74823 RepID=A0AA42B1X9_PAPNU|nr:hypothetical protein [Papaver nudicaule]
MENVVDLLRFSNGFLGRHAVSRLISLDYQVRVGIMAAGSFGVPQFRQRVFLWDAQLGKVIQIAEASTVPLTNTRGRC